MLRKIQYYLVTTKNLENGLWFRDDEDYKVGMNLVAQLTVLIGVRVLAFILMSNHVHFVLQCTDEQAISFITSLKERYSRHVRRKYGIGELLRRNQVEISRIAAENESLEKAIAYVMMNPVAANICLNAWAYAWGSGDCFFRSTPVKGIPLDSFSQRKRFSILRTRQDIPSSGLLLNELGYVDPASYVVVRQVENIFRTPRRMNFFLVNSSKAKRRIESESDAPAFRDHVVAAGVGDLCQSLFHSPVLEDLEEAQQSEVLKQVRFRFSANVHQLARTSGLSYERVAYLLDLV